jgi:bifunctional non-homologous end joining protein LigD
MKLTKYKAKRNFQQTPEPRGGLPSDEILRFVVQKHDATRLHYDFRLELDGVLKSWAVPKGPSTDPSVKRLAVMVEDHPYDYRGFEGIIPRGYGAGTVIVWDEGYYEPAKGTYGNKKARARELRRQLQAGLIEITLHGRKLKGKYALVKTRGRGKNDWLLIKMNDEYASPEDITLKDKSVLSRKTLDQVKNSTINIHESDRVKETARRSRKVGGIGAVKITAAIERLLKNAPAAAFPAKITPMLATLVDRPFDRQGWLYEVKWDGYRALAFLKKGAVELKSRNDKSFTKKFYPITRALMDWKINAVIDGEIVVVGEDGISHFESLQNWRSEADGYLLYYVFDIPWLEGRNLAGMPLTERQTILKSLVPENSIIKMSDSFEGSGLKIFDAARKMGLEGIIAKRADSPYHAGDRTRDWLKIKAKKRQEMVIGGFTKNEASRKLFSALLVGVFDGKKLVYTGKVGTGFSDNAQQDLMNRFQRIIIKKSPFAEEPDINKPTRFQHNPPRATATWLKPELVCEVSFAEMTADGVMRHPSFEGMRMDKQAKDVVMETAKSPAKAAKAAKPGTRKMAAAHDTKKGRGTLLNPTDETQVREINGHTLRFTNLGKIYWPREKITKRDLLNYYYQAAPCIMPYLKDRPQSMNRHPDGITGEHFYYKDITGRAPEWLDTYLYHSEEDNRDRKYLVAKDDASLLYMASLGCIEMNPWHSRVETEDYPDWCVLDLDPDRTTFDQVIEAALVINGILEDMGIAGYPKTSGSRGMHIYIPLGAKYTYEQSKEFARVIAILAHAQLPGFTSIERPVKDRGGKMYIDFLQNRPQATVCAPYSLRPKPGATVSMPLQWKEVKKGLKMTDFTIYNALERIQRKGDIFSPVLGKGINLEKVLKKFDNTKMMRCSNSLTSAQHTFPLVPRPSLLYCPLTN